MKERTYRSELREDQARATRERILDAVAALLRAGDAELTYVSIARAARVSTPTVYRNFPTRKDLYEAYYLRLEGAQAGDLPRTATEWNEALRRFFGRYDAPGGPHAVAGRLSAHWEFSRTITVPIRRRAFEELLDEHAPGLREPERTWIVDLGVVLASSAMAEAMRGYLDRSGAETADRVGLAIDALFAHAAALAKVPSTPTEESP